MNKILKKLNVLLNKKQKAQMAGIVCLMLVSGLLESLGVGLIVPMMQVVMDPESIRGDGFVSRFFRAFHFADARQMAFFFMIALIAVFVVKNVFLFIVNKVQLRFIYTNQFATSRRVMIGFMKRPYEY